VGLYEAEIENPENNWTIYQMPLERLTSRFHEMVMRLNQELSTARLTSTTFLVLILINNDSYGIKLDRGIRRRGERSLLGDTTRILLSRNILYSSFLRLCL
jgi:hypothetical protein